MIIQIHPKYPFTGLNSILIYQDHGSDLTLNIGGLTYKLISLSVSTFYYFLRLWQVKNSNFTASLTISHRAFANSISLLF